MITFLFIKNTFPQDSTETERLVWSVDYYLTAGYDDNILKYSQKYLERFANNQDPGRFHVSSVEDFISQHSLRLSKTFQFFGDLKSIPSVQVRYKQYARNNIKNFAGAELRWTQYFTNLTRLNIAFDYTDDFYAKHYRDADYTPGPDSFRPFKFTKKDLSLILRNYFIKGVQTSFYASCSWYRYTPDFTEYNSTDYLAGLSLNYALNKNADLQAGYTFVLSDAKGYDGDLPGEDKGNSDDSDPSFKEHTIYLTAETKLPEYFIKKSSLELTGYYYITNYTSEKTAAADPFHAGRTDYTFDISAYYKIDLSRLLELALFVNYDFRKTGTDLPDNAETVADEKEYTQFTTGLRVRFNIKF